MLYNSDGTEMTYEQRCELHRARRNKYLNTYVDKINAVRWFSMTESERNQWTAYYQALLDIPQQVGWPDNIEWPTPPTP